jgi:hypothetical protein
MAADRIWSFKTAVGSYRPESGDLNGDGQCTADDAGIELDIALGNATASDQQLSGGDLAPVVNGTPQPDGKIDVGDVVIMLRKVAGLVHW